MKAINGLDWSAGVDRALLTTPVYVTKHDLHNDAYPPTVRIDVGNDLAVAVGVDPWYGAGKVSERLANVPTELWYLTGKIYPRATGNKAPGWGGVSIRGIRHYLTPAEASAALAYPTDTTMAWASLVAASSQDRPAVQAVSSGTPLPVRDTGWRALTTWAAGAVTGFPLTASWAPGAGTSTRAWPGTSCATEACRWRSSIGRCSLHCRFTLSCKRN